MIGLKELDSTIRERECRQDDNILSRIKDNNNILSRIKKSIYRII